MLGGLRQGLFGFEEMESFLLTGLGFLAIVGHEREFEFTGV